ncbi:AMP-binding protein [Streptomyces sp. NPDC051315]|uniref:AMP-binding protein n=1 Tax=Streptomyces sp. NPDC051315 TaxID=3365650 RepID=UPI00379460F7
MGSFGVSAAHKGMWLAQKIFPERLNHALTIWDVNGALDEAAMELAFLHVMGEAEVLRVNFVDDGSGLRLVPRELGDWQPFFLDVSAEADPEHEAREALAEMLRHPFDLEHDLLFRLGVVRIAADRSLVAIAYHHLISDGFGAGGLVSRRLAEVYTALRRGSDVPEPPQPWDVASYADVATRYLDSQEFTEDTRFWRDYLADAPPPAQLPRIVLSDALRAELSQPVSRADQWSQLSSSIGMVSRTLTVPHAEAAAWTEAARALGVWMSALVTAAAAAYFRHRCDEPEFLLSLAVGNRTGTLRGTPGLAVNVVPVRARVPLGASFAETAEAIVDETYEIVGHTACHYSEIQRASGTDASGRGSFGAVVNVVEFAEELDFAGSPARHLGATTGTFDELSIGVYTDGGADSDLFLRLDAPAGMYSGAELCFIGTELIAAVRALLTDVSAPVGALDLAEAVRGDEPTARQAVGEPLPDLSVPDLFARQVAAAPDATALVGKGSRITYRELDEQAGRIAAALRRRGVGPETVVAVDLPRSVELAVALLGVVKAGGAYVPVDPDLSAQQSRAVVQDAAARIVVTDPETAGLRGAGADVPTVVFGDILSERADDDVRPTRVTPRPDNVLAVMYDRGAAPGVAVTHRNLHHLVRDANWREGGRGAVRWQSPHSSDALALELWTPLLNGGRVVVAAEAQDADAPAASGPADEACTIRLSTDQFAQIAAERPKDLAGAREVWISGDRAPAAAVRRVRAAVPELTVVQGHGATEAPLFAVCRQEPGDDPAGPAAALGQPADGTVLHVLGPGLAPVPAGVVGELYVAGPGVARGYAGRPRRTAERFVACPFGPAGALMYRTGERVRRDARGRLDHVGQVGAPPYVQGARVEPAEVEDVLCEHPDVLRAVVAGAPDPSGQQRLVTYVVPVGRRTSGGDAGAGEEADVLDGRLRRFVAARLPDFMVPSLFMVVDRLPVTTDGRVDRVSLPEPRFGDTKYRAPRNRTEQVLAEAFADVLEVDRVGIEDDFFDLGGNSLRAIRLVGLIRAELDLEVSIRTLFATRSISGLAAVAERLSHSSRPALRRRTRDGHVL